MFDRHLPEVNPLNERPVEALGKKGWDEVLLYSVLHILQTEPEDDTEKAFLYTYLHECIGAFQQAQIGAQTHRD